VEVSYFEIYQEKIKDLLSPQEQASHNLKVRNHKILGPVNQLTGNLFCLRVLAISSVLLPLLPRVAFAESGFCREWLLPRVAFGPNNAD
jgi:hypothetical protein